MYEKLSFLTRYYFKITRTHYLGFMKGIYLFGVSLLLCCFIGQNLQAKLISTDSLELEKVPSKPLPPTILSPDSSVFDLSGYIPKVYPDIIKDRLKCIPATIEMTYHKDVLNWIKLYTVRKRDLTQRILERSSYYFPIFEEALKRHKLPEELKYLSIVESALVPRAQSWAAAVGLWQFIPSTGKQYDLQQDWFIDERMDLYKSTDAACRYLKFLYKYHGNWQLALAAYNCGPGRVNWAVRKAGGKNVDFWKIYHYLPRETRSYVPAFIAATYAVNYSDQHFIFAQSPREFIPSDTILVSQFVNIDEFARQIHIPEEVMQDLNPHLKKKAIPSYKRNYPLRFPAQMREYIEEHRVEILRSCRQLNNWKAGYTAGANASSNDLEGKMQTAHIVSPGQSLGYIAAKYGVSVANLRAWNRLNSNLIYPNQRIAVWIPDPNYQKPAPLAQDDTASPQLKSASLEAANKSQDASKAPSKDKGAKIYYTVESGDSLWEISKKNGNISVSELLRLNSLRPGQHLIPGQKLVVGVLASPY